MTDSPTFLDALVHALASAAAWAAFRDVCRSNYTCAPAADGPLTAARLLGERESTWDTVSRG